MTQLKLIGAGLPRTATLSQKIALEMLGLGPCYHMVEILSDLGLVDDWANAFEGSVTWDDVLAGYQASVDWPGAFFYRELMETYPEAKVLLSVRESDAWARSMGETIWGVLYGDTLIGDLSSARGRIDPLWRRYIEVMQSMWQKSGLLAGAEVGLDLDELAGAMGRYNAEVIDTVPAERLLVWSAADGWEPLCEFLEVPVPQAPFPRVNDRAMFVERIVDASLASLCEWHRTRPSPGEATA